MTTVQGRADGTTAESSPSAIHLQVQAVERQAFSEVWVLPDWTSAIAVLKILYFLASKTRKSLEQPLANTCFLFPAFVGWAWHQPAAYLCLSYGFCFSGELWLYTPLSIPRQKSRYFPLASWTHLSVAMVCVKIHKAYPFHYVNRYAGGGVRWMRRETYGERNWDLSCAAQSLSQGSVLTLWGVSYLAIQWPSAGLPFVNFVSFGEY